LSIFFVIGATVSCSLATYHTNDNSNDHGKPRNGDALQEKQETEEQTANIGVEGHTLRRRIQEWLKDVDENIFVAF